MVFFNYALRKLNAKIVYYGPGLGGKTTNLQWIHDHFEGGQRGKMISLATEGDRTIFFDLLPIDIGTIRGMDVTLQLYTVPGQVHYNSTRQLVLRGADGVVFVADSQRTMGASNVESFENLQENLMLQGIDLKDFPHVLAFNKQDLRDLLSPEDLNESLNIFSVPIFEAIATEGIGVQETLEGIVKLVMRNLREKYEPVAGATGPQAPAPMELDVPVPAQPESSGSVMVTPPVEDEAAAPAFEAPVAEETEPDVTVEEAMQNIDLTEGVSVFKEEDEIATSVYQEMEGTDRTDPVAGFEKLTSDQPSPMPPEEEMPPIIAEDGPTPVLSVVDEPAVDSEPAVVEEDFSVLVPEPPEEAIEEEVLEAIPEVVPEVVSELPDAEVAEADFRDDLATDPEFTPGGPERETFEETTDDLFEPEAPVVDSPREEPVEVPEFEAVEEPVEEAIEEVVETEFDAPVNDVPATVAPAVPSDRFEDTIEAPGPFAPSGASDETVEDEVSEVKSWHEAVDPQVSKALGASEDREALASLSLNEEPEIVVPSEVLPVTVDEEEEVPPGPADTISVTDMDVEPEFEPEPVVEALFDEEPPVAEPLVEEPVADEPAWEETDVDVVAAADPVVEEPVVEEPVVEESVVEEPVVEESVVEEPVVEEPVVEEPIVDEPVVAEPVVEEPIADAPVPPPPPSHDWREKSQPIVVGSGDPFAAEPEPVVPEIVSAEAALVPESRNIDVTAEDNQLHLQFKGSGAIAEMGQVRALDIEVPVPGQWVGNRKVTLQLRLTLTPVEDQDD